jgi:hypothetical protein
MWLSDTREWLDKFLGMDEAFGENKRDRNRGSFVVDSGSSRNQQNGL